MRSLEHARQRARELRLAIGLASEGLLLRLRAYIEDNFQIELCPVPASAIDGSRAEVSPSEHCLNYDERLEHQPDELVWLLAHELGHLTLHHKRLSQSYAKPNALFGSAFLNDGASALSRYSPRSREEAEANAFANECICPSREIFDEWRNDPTATSYSIAKRHGLPEKLVRVQMAEAVYQLLIRPDVGKEEKPRHEFTYTDHQIEAATSIGTPVLVTAGPGTGKTATLIKRVEYLLGEIKASPQEMLVLTFSNDAAEELRERIAEKFGDEVATDIEIATFHGFGFAFLHRFGLGIKPEVVILDEARQEELVSKIFGTTDCPGIINLREPEETVKQIVRHINHLKDRGIYPDQLAAAVTPWNPSDQGGDGPQKGREFLSVFHAYEQAKTALPAVDFADLITLPLRILESSPALVTKIRAKYQWVMVDEYQDVSRSVAFLLRQLCGNQNPPWVVGDARQTIYRFRGAASENVIQFEEDFPGARVFDLDTNFRSCEAIVRAANQLAAIIESPRDGDLDPSERWEVGTHLASLGEPVIQIARANSDEAEYEGIAAQVRAWLGRGIRPRDIAVLARRNVDVRNIMLALGARGIRATTSGIITTEGAAGDLAAVVTFADRPTASLSRIVFSLGRGRFDNTLLNDFVRRLSEAAESEEETLDRGIGEALLAEVKRLHECLRQEFHSSDAFAMICAFLFNGSDYLRRLLKEPDGAKQALTLSEIVTTLSRAANYRFTHPDLEPAKSRIGFGQYFRSTLNSSLPCLEAPRSLADAVRVMTCHASKGLEFPCVIVAGQTLSQAREEWWLPTWLRTSQEDDLAQAEALLFVGITRAQRALLVSFAETKSGTKGSRPREVTPLLERWQITHAIPLITWPPSSTPSEEIAMGAVWGGTPRGKLAARALDEKYCAIRTYLEEFVGIKFPTTLRSLYPVFFVALRLAMERVVRQAQETKNKVKPDEAAEIFVGAFPESEFADHPHYPVYLQRGQAYLNSFAQAYSPQPKAIEFYDLSLLIEEADQSLIPLRFDLVAYFRGEDGLGHAIGFRPESLAKSVAKNRPGELLWSGLETAKRMAFLLLKDRDPSLQPWVFSAADGVLYKYLWNQKPANMVTEAERVNVRLRDLSRRKFEAKLSERACKVCPVRIACPHWIGALQ